MVIADSAAFLLLLVTTVLAIKSIKALSGNTSTTGVSVAMIVFCTIQAVKVATEATLYLLKSSLIHFLSRDDALSQGIEAAVWVMFDLTPLIVLLWIHR